MVTATRGRKNQKIDAAEQQKVLQKVSAMNANDLNNEFSNMQITVQKTFAGLQAEVNNHYSTCEELDTAITLKQSRLKDLHGIEATAVQLDDLQAQLEAQRNQIVAEGNEADLLAAELENARIQQWKREDDQWKYETDQKHRKVVDDFNQNLLKQQRDEVARQEALQKSWKDRDESLVERESELDSLRQQVDAFPGKTDAEVKKAVAINEYSIKREYETKIALLQKDSEVNTKLNKERETALQGTVTRLEGQCASLHQQVESAEKRSAEIAKTAFESVSGRDALAAVQRHNTESQTQQSGKQNR